MLRHGAVRDRRDLLTHDLESEILGCWALTATRQLLILLLSSILDPHICHHLLPSFAANQLHR